MNDSSLSSSFRDNESCDSPQSKYQTQALYSRHGKRYHIIAAEPWESMAQELTDEFPDRFSFHPTAWNKFPDGTDHITVGGLYPENFLAGEHVLFLAAFDSNDSTLSQFSVMIYVLQCFIESLTIVLPYFPVGTMERVDQEGTVATAATYSHMLSSLPNCGKPTRFMTYDLHTLQNRFYLHGNAFASLHTAIPLLKDIPKDAVAFPDDGAAKRFGKFFDSEMIVCRKTREANNTRRISLQDGDPKGKHVMIVDDLVQTGGTLYETCKLLKSLGAASVQAFCTHAIFPNQSWRHFLVGGKKHCVTKFWITNSVPTTASQLPADSVFQVLHLKQQIVHDLDNH